VSVPDSGSNFSALAAAKRRVKFQKRSQLFIGTHDEPLSVIAMRISNPDYFASSRDAQESVLC
jgi:hypothetical protein